MLTLIRGYLMLFKSEGYAQYFGKICLSNKLKLANI